MIDMADNVLILLANLVEISAQGLESRLGLADNVVDFRLYRCGAFRRLGDIVEHFVGFIHLIKASVFTSSATTAKPFPRSPALAASMEAFRARMLVWSAIVAILLVHALIFLTAA